MVIFEHFARNISLFKYCRNFYSFYTFNLKNKCYSILRHSQVLHYTCTFIAQFGGRQPRKFMSPEGEAPGRREFSGLNRSLCLPTNWAINCLLNHFLLTKKLNWSFCILWPFIPSDCHFAQNLYYDITALVVAAQCGETWRLEGGREGDMKICLLPTWHL